MSAAPPRRATPRIEPSPRVGLMMFAAYAVVVVGLMRISGIGYEHLFDSTSNTLRAAVLPLAVGAVLVIAFLRWARWDGVFHELQALSKGKLLASLPVVMIVVIVLTSWASAGASSPSDTCS